MVDRFKVSGLGFLVISSSQAFVTLVSRSSVAVGRPAGFFSRSKTFHKHERNYTTQHKPSQHPRKTAARPCTAPSLRPC